MTAILCDIAYGKFFIFADGRVTNDNHILTNNCKKIYRREVKQRIVLFAFAGDSAPCDYLIEKYMSFKDYKEFMIWGFEGSTGDKGSTLPASQHINVGIIADYNIKTKQLIMLTLEKEPNSSIIAVYTHTPGEMPYCYGCGSMFLKMGYFMVDGNEPLMKEMGEEDYLSYMTDIFNAVSKVDGACGPLEMVEEIKL